MHDLHDSWTLPSVLKEKEVITFAKSDTTDGLRVPQVARSPKVVIFVPTTTDIYKSIALPSLAHEHAG